MDTFKQELALKPALNNTILGKLIERQALFCQPSFKALQEGHNHHPYVK
jgi:hypothetical protein